MATNYTTNYALCQWEPTDPVIRTDFNADNAKLEAALTSLETRVSMLSRVVPRLSYYIGQLSILDLLDRQKYLSQQCMLYDAFVHPEDFTLSGGAAIQNNTLTLNGSGATGAATARVLSLQKSDWTQVRLWVHFSGGDVQPKLNDAAMEYVGSAREMSVSGVSCWIREYVWNGQGSNAAKISLELTCSNVSSMSVYDYSAMFF